MDTTNHYKIVLPGHLNDSGSLFGGYLLQWVDEIGYIGVNLDFPNRSFVTIGLDNVEFRHAIHEGQILRFECKKTHVGNTSVSYKIKIFGQRYQSHAEHETLFETKITFVCINQEGQKRKIHP